jgi:hypothetical protein
VRESGSGKKEEMKFHPIHIALDLNSSNSPFSLLFALLFFLDEAALFVCVISF